MEDWHRAVETDDFEAFEGIPNYPTYNQNNLDIDQLIMSLDYDGIRSVLGLYTPISAFTTRQATKIPEVNAMPFLCSELAVKLHHPTKSGEDLMNEIREQLLIKLANPCVPGMTLTSRKQLVCTETILECCRTVGVVAFVYMVYGQKQLIISGVDNLEDIYARHKMPLRFIDAITGEARYVRCIIDLARTDSNTLMPLLKFPSRRPKRIKKATTHRTYWLQFGGVSFIHQGNKFKMYPKAVHELKRHFRKLNRIPKVAITIQEKGRYCSLSVSREANLCPVTAAAAINSYCVK